MCNTVQITIILITDIDRSTGMFKSCSQSKNENPYHLTNLCVPWWQSTRFDLNKHLIVSQCGQVSLQDQIYTFSISI